jgi:formate dehydrogenase major subunit
MPCLLSEVEEAQAEGVEIRFLVTPVRIRCMGHHRYSLTCRHMELGEPDASGRRRPTPVEGSEFELSCSTVIAAIGQRVETEVAEREGLALTRWGIAADMRTMATNLEGVFAGGDAVLGADLAVRAVAGGRIAASSIDQYLRGEVVRGVPAPVSVTMRPMDDGERAAMFRGLERAPRVPMPTITFARRRSSFQEVEGGWTRQNAEREARRCLRCGCSKAESCRLRELATEYGSDPSHFAGARRRFARDLTHPEITYEPGKCVMCQACVRIASEEEDLGMALVGRGFDVAVAPPFGMTVKEGLRQTARRCAEACPTGALALRPSGECGNWTTSPSGEPGQRSRV